MINYLIDWLGIDTSLFTEDGLVVIQIALIVVGAVFTLYMVICFFQFLLKLFNRK